MRTIAIIRENTWLPGINHGFGNGYVAIPKDHILYGMNYDSVLIDVTDSNGILDVRDISNREDIKSLDVSDLISAHGGITYSGNAFDFINNHRIEVNNTSILDEAEGIDWNNYWIFGFDTCHCNDDKDECDINYVINQTRRLQIQLEAITKESVLNYLKKK